MPLGSRGRAAAARDGLGDEGGGGDGEEAEEQQDDRQGAARLAEILRAPVAAWNAPRRGSLESPARKGGGILRASGQRARPPVNVEF